MSQDEVQELVARLLPLGPVEARRMFGGWGIFHEDLMFALVANGTLYLKVDAETEARFADAGSEPFTYQRPGKQIKMSYWRLPADDDLLDWAALGLAAAQRAKKPKKKRRR
ncbi:MAG: TfoX/Sxy family protein [Pseudomonadota bacterium]